MRYEYYNDELEKAMDIERGKADYSQCDKDVIFNVIIMKYPQLKQVAIKHFEYCRLVIANSNR